VIDTFCLSERHSRRITRSPSRDRLRCIDSFTKHGVPREVEQLMKTREEQKPIVPRLPPPPLPFLSFPRPPMLAPGAYGFPSQPAAVTLPQPPLVHPQPAPGLVVMNNFRTQAPVPPQSFATSFFPLQNMPALPRVANFGPPPTPIQNQLFLPPQVTLFGPPPVQNVLSSSSVPGFQRSQLPPPQPFQNIVTVHYGVQPEPFSGTVSSASYAAAVFSPTSYSSAVYSQQQFSTSYCACSDPIYCISS
jgi:hypothetical protein